MLVGVLLENNVTRNRTNCLLFPPTRRFRHWQTAKGVLGVKAVFLQYGSIFAAPNLKATFEHQTFPAILMIRCGFFLVPDSLGQNLALEVGRGTDKTQGGVGKCWFIPASSSNAIKARKPSKYFVRHCNVPHKKLLQCITSRETSEMNHLVASKSPGVGGGSQQSFILGGSAARSKPFPFYMSFFRMPSIENGPPPRMP